LLLGVIVLQTEDFRIGSVLMVVSKSAAVRDGVVVRPEGAWGSDVDHLRWLARAGWIPAHLKGKTVLDLGCGSGEICEWAVASGAGHVTGIDLVAPRRPLATPAGPAGSTGPTLWQWRMVDLSSPTWSSQIGEVHDIVFAFDIVEHVPAPGVFLRQCAAVMRPGATLVLTTPNVNSWERMLRPSTWSATIDPQHELLFTRWSLGFLLERCGFTVSLSWAPVRRLEFLPNAIHPWVGAQIFMLAQKSSATR
jgi:2-polyprenyl-3-methyl-5-hydroxy-6-metoxy-1,4-benzoquinol methylase